VTACRRPAILGTRAVMGYAAVATNVGVSLASLGNVKTQTLRAFRAWEFQAIIGKMVK